MRHIGSIKDNRTFVDGVDARQQVENRRLPGTVRADQRRSAAAPYVHRDVIDNLKAAKTFVNAGNGQNVIGHFRLLRFAGIFATVAGKYGGNPVLHRAGHDALGADDHHQDDKSAEEDKPAICQPS